MSAVSPISRGLAALLLATTAGVGDAALRSKLEHGIERAEAGDLGAALDEFVAARDGASGAVWECATFDWTRALYERARVRDLPSSPPTEGARPPPSVIADARARLSAMRGDLVAARGGLIELLARRPDDGEARAGLARVAARLREVIDRDLQWRAVADRDHEHPGNARPNTDGRLRPGPSRNKASSGAPGERRGESEEGSDERAGEGEAPPATRAGERELTEEEAQALRDRLREVRGERRAFDERRADAAAASSERRQ